MTDCDGKFVLALIPKEGFFKGEVHISELPFQVGRHVTDFSVLGKSGPEAKHAIGKISREHAEIFRDGGAIKIKDLGSLNGTYVNQKRLEGDSPVVITDGDHVSFSDYADFIVQIQRSTITPSPLHNTGDVIYTSDAVEEISKGTEDSSTVKETSDTPASTDSDNDNVDSSGSLKENQADLDKSTVASAKSPVNTDPVEEKSEDDDPHTTSPQLPKSMVKTPDVIIPEASGIKQTSDSEMRRSIAPGTIMLDTSNRVESMFDLVAQSKQVEEPEKKAPNVKTAPKKSSAGWRKTWSDFKLTRVTIIVLIVVAAAAGGIYHVVTDDIYKVEKLLESGEYRKAVAAGDAYLTATNDEKAERLTLQAASNYLVKKSGWLSAMQAKDYAKARTAVEELEDIGSHSQNVKKMISFLNLAIEFIEQGEAQERSGRLLIYKDEEKFSEMLDLWNQDQNTFKRTGQLMKETVEECPDLLAQVSAYRVRFTNYRKTLILSMNDLKQATDDTLTAGRPNDVRELYSRFNATYSNPPSGPKVDISPLTIDLDLYLVAWKAVESRDVYPLLTISAESFDTPVFKKHATELLKRVPATETLRQFNAARSSWRSGQAGQAITILNGLKASDWSSVAFKLSQTYQAKSKAVESVKALTEPLSAKDRQRVLEVYKNVLAESDDAVYRQMIQPMFQATLTTAKKEIETAYSNASKAWRLYSDMGRIIQKHRLTNDTPADFVEMAGHLRVAFKTIETWHRLSVLLGDPIPAERSAFRIEVLKECRFQWRRMNEAKLLVDPKVVAKKLHYLPEPPEDWK